MDVLTRSSWVLRLRGSQGSRTICEEKIGLSCSIDRFLVRECSVRA
jgi:hypothetical protein